MKVHIYHIYYSYVENNDAHRCLRGLNLKKEFRHCKKEVIKYLEKEHNTKYIHLQEALYIGRRAKGYKDLDPPTEERKEWESIEISSASGNIYLTEQGQYRAEILSHGVVTVDLLMLDSWNCIYRSSDKFMEAVPHIDKEGKDAWSLKILSNARIISLERFTGVKL